MTERPPRPSYRDRPWLDRLSEAQRGPVAPPPSLLYAFLGAVRRVPDRHALAYFDGRLTYRETDELSGALAGRLAARGFRPGDRAAVALQNTPQLVLAVLAVWRAGGIVVPVNPMLRADEVAHVLRDAEVSALVCADHAWEEFLRETAAGTSVRTVLTVHEADLQTRNDERVLRGPRPAPARDAEDLLAAARSGA
ncbi:AMP-binding protein, partial [Streptomyces sp. NPDC049577]|uniref:AMP-binding protein n=1 Tax=Streptomyces sp. NPDC049577 TaxID=3155153 RepID=UPI00343A37AA